MRTDLNGIDVPLTVAVMGDTHIKKPRGGLASDDLDAIRGVKPDLILHTGDIVDLSVLDALEMIAPVFAVRGNRDFAHWRQLPAVRLFEYGDTEICLLHGHGTLPQYLRMKVSYWRGKLNPRFISRQLPPEAAESDIVLFGHSHIPQIWTEDGKLFINPGAFSEGSPGDRFRFPAFAWFRLEPSRRIIAEILFKQDYWHVYCNKEIDWKINGGTL